jgi:hypothetical protein
VTELYNHLADAATTQSADEPRFATTLQSLWPADLEPGRL